MKRKVSELKYSQKLYPREKYKTAKIAEYVDALRAENKFPPIKITEDGSILDGVHRWKAHQEVGLEEIEVEIVDVGDTPHLLYSAGCNSKHGFQLTSPEKEAVARTVYEADNTRTQEYISDWLGVSQQTVSRWIKDMKAVVEEGEEQLFLWLSLLGWTQDETGSVLGIEKSAVSQKSLKVLKSVFLNFFVKGHPISEIASRNNAREALTLAVVAEGKNDQERMKLAQCGIQPYDVWNFSGTDSRFGDSSYPGRIPAGLILHTLYFFTEQSEYVIDPMAGGGTTIDCCAVMGRKCYGYDINITEGRRDIIEYNILKDGWPDRVKKAGLIFWDPPYYKKKDSEYIEGSISALSRKEYLEFFDDAFKEAYNLVKKGTRLAFLMSDWTPDEGDEDEGIFIWHYANMIEEAGWQIKRNIQTPLTTQQVMAAIVNKYRDEKKLARLERYLLIGEK